jgi:hypothetical protein
MCLQNAAWKKNGLKIMMQRSWCGSCDYSVELVLSSVVYYSTAVSLSIAADILILSTGVGPLSLSSRERERERERDLYYVT